MGPVSTHNHKYMYLYLPILDSYHPSSLGVMKLLLNSRCKITPRQLQVQSLGE